MRTLCEVEDQQVNYIEFWPLASEEDCLSFFYKGTNGNWLHPLVVPISATIQFILAILLVF